MKKLIQVCVILLSMLFIFNVNAMAYEGPLDYVDMGTYIYIEGFRTIPNDTSHLLNTSLEVPSKINGILVREIGSQAFRNQRSLKTVTLPHLNEIGDCAFMGCQIEELNWSGATTIGDSAFSGLRTKSLAILNTKKVGDYVFEYSRIESVYVSNSLSSCGKTIFRGCTSLKTATVSDGIAKNMAYCFGTDTGLKNLTLSDNVRNILMDDENAAIFYNLDTLSVNPNNTVFYIENNCLINKETKTLIVALKNATIPSDGSVTKIGDYAFYGHTDLTSITIPDSVTSIGDYAFRGCTSLTSVTIPNSVTSIGACAFADCTSVNNVTIPDSVTTIGKYAFGGCTSLTSATIPNSVFESAALIFPQNLKNLTLSYDVNFEFVTADNAPLFSSLDSLKVDSNNPFIYVQNNCIINKESKTLLLALKNAVIPNDNTVTKIGKNAFYNRVELTAVTIPNSVTSIDNSAFSGCASLTSVTIPNSVTSIGNSAFSGCTSLTSVNIPNSVTSIGDSAFYGCTSLTNVAIPNTVTFCATNAFSVCDGIITFATPAKYLSCVPKTVKNLIITEATTMSEKAAKSFKDLTEITLPFAGKSVNDATTTSFYWIFGRDIVDYRYVPLVPQSLKKVTLTAAERIDTSCFYECSHIEEIVLNEGVKSINQLAFARCFSLKTITIPKSVETIYTSSFSECDSLTTVRCYRNTKGEELANYLGVEIEYLDEECETHDFADWEIVDMPQCNVQGSHKRVCNACGYIESEPMDATGHNYVFDKIIYEATEINPGLQQSVCTVCGETLQTEIPVITPEFPDNSVEVSDIVEPNESIPEESIIEDSVPEESIIEESISEESIVDTDISNDSSMVESENDKSQLEDSGSDNTWIYILVGALALLLVGAVVVIVVLLKKKSVPTLPESKE